MSLQDPIANMITQIRNAQAVLHNTVIVPHSKIKANILHVLKNEGYIHDYFVINEADPAKKAIQIQLKYYNHKPVIQRIKRISKVSLRVYRSCKQIPSVPGYGILILTTSKGIMSNLEAKKRNIGGEIICEVA